MNKIVAIQADALNSINVKTDTTLLIALEAQKRFYQIYWYQTKDLSLINGKVYGNLIIMILNLQLKILVQTLLSIRDPE